MKNPKREIKKLKIQTTSIRQLTTEQTTQVAGGRTTGGTNGSCVDGGTDTCIC